MAAAERSRKFTSDYEEATRKLWSHEAEPDSGDAQEPDQAIRWARRRNEHIQLHLLFEVLRRASPKTTAPRSTEDRDAIPSAEELLDIAGSYWDHYAALARKRRYSDLYAAHDHYAARLRETGTRKRTLDDLYRFALRVWRLLHDLGGRYGFGERIRDCVPILATDEEREGPSWHETHVGTRRRALQLRLGDGEDRDQIEDDRHLWCHTFDLEATWGEAAKKLVAISNAVWDDLARATHENDRVKFIQRLLRSLVHELELRGSVRTWMEVHRHFIIEEVVDKAEASLQRQTGAPMNAIIAHAIIRTDPSVASYEELKKKLKKHTGYDRSTKSIKQLIRPLFPDLYKTRSFPAFEACLRAYVRLLAVYIGEVELSEPFGPTGIYTDLEWPGV